jgi:itaconate CoA-transferase
LSLPLQGLTVIAVEQAVAAPYCTSRLADAGARVLKVERAEGDFARGYDEVCNGQSSYFVWLNRGKQSVVVDLGAPDGKAWLEAQLAHADVLVQNLKPGALARLGFPFERLRDSFPRLVVCSISGYGESGPLAERKAYDLLIQAESGLSSITGGPEAPARVGVSLVDIATGAMAYSAILEALIARNATGGGADIRVSMFDVMAEWLAVPLLQHEGGQTPSRVGLAHPSIAPYGAFRTADGKDIVISIQSEREWVSFCERFLENPGAATDPRFATNIARVRHRGETDAMVAARFAALDDAVAQAALENADTAFAIVSDMARLSRHPHLRRIEVSTPNGAVALPAPAPLVVGAPRNYGAVPALGQNRLSDEAD